MFLFHIKSGVELFILGAWLQVIGVETEPNLLSLSQFCSSDIDGAALTSCLEEKRSRYKFSPDENKTSAEWELQRFQLDRPCNVPI